MYNDVEIEEEEEEWRLTIENWLERCEETENVTKKDALRRTMDGWIPGRIFRFSAGGPFAKESLRTHNPIWKITIVSPARERERKNDIDQPLRSILQFEISLPFDSSGLLFSSTWAWPVFCNLFVSIFLSISLIRKNCTDKRCVYYRLTNRAQSMPLRW